MKLPSPACVALTVTVPMPVMVTVLPLIVAGPEKIWKLTGKPDDAVALTVKGGSPKLLFDNAPKFKQNGTVIGAFGSNTSKAIEEAGLKLDIKAPQPQAPSMVSALELFLSAKKK